MHSTLKCNKTFYFNPRDGNIHVVESDALIVSFLKQGLIGESAVSYGLNFQGIRDKNLNVCGIYPCFNRKLCGVEQSIIFISADWRLFRLKTLYLVRHSFVKKTGLDLWHKRLGHISNDTIIRTVGHSNGIGNIPKRIPKGTNCPDCMIGKCQRQDAPSSRVEKTQHTLQQVNWDLAMFNEILLKDFVML